MTFANQGRDIDKNVIKIYESASFSRFNLVQKRIFIKINKNENLKKYDLIFKISIQKMFIESLSAT